MQTSNAMSTAGLLTSLAHALPDRSTLRRRAHQIANKLNRRHTRAVDAKAAELLALLLSATDTPELADYSEDGILDRGFDE